MKCFFYSFIGLYLCCYRGLYQGIPPQAEHQSFMASFLNSGKLSELHRTQLKKNNVKRI